MTMSLFIFSDKEMSSVTEWQAAIDKEGYELKLSPDVQFEIHSGFLPADLHGVRTGFECAHIQASELMQEMSQVVFDHEWKFALEFTWLGSKENELLAAWMGATAYARATDGIILDGEETKFHTPTQAREIVDDLEHPSPAALAAIKEIKERLSRKA